MRPTGAGRRDSRFSIERDEDFVAVFTQSIGEEIDRAFVVFHQQYPNHFCLPPTARADSANDPSPTRALD